jgi:PAS domain S-box-containing protein
VSKALSSIIAPSPALHGDEPAAASAQGLADRSALALIAVERAKMPMVVTDPRQSDNPVVLANQAFLDLTGYRADEVLGRNCRFLQGAQTSPATVAAIREAMAQERGIDTEILNYRKDGSLFWNQLSLSPVHDDDGKLLYVLGSQIDVTEVRKVQSLEAAEHRLLREVDHRARNVLAIVEGIVRLSRSDDAKLYAASIHQRVQALARAHTLLAQRGWQDIELDEVIREQIDAFGATRVSLEGPQVTVPAFVVQPLALVIHELVSNALAHGALSSPDGRLAIRWDVVPQNNGFVLRWVEADGPPPKADPSPGCGTAMMTAMIERQLRGALDRQWTSTGLTVTLSLPGPRARPEAVARPG